MRADLVTSAMLIGWALCIWLVKVTTGSSGVHIDIHSTGALGHLFMGQCQGIHGSLDCLQWKKRSNVCLVWDLEAPRGYGDLARQEAHS